MKKKLLFSMLATGILTVGLLIWSCGDEVTNITEVTNVLPSEPKLPQPLLSELDEGPAYRFDYLEVDSLCDEGNDLCPLGDLLNILGFQDYFENQELNIILVSLWPTSPVEVSDIILAQVRGIRDWANDPEWGGLDQFYVEPESIDPETSLVKTTMRGENYYESSITAVTDGPMSLSIEIVGQVLYLIPPLYDVKLSANIEEEELTDGVIKAVAELDDLAEVVVTFASLLNITVTRDGEPVPVDKEIAIYWLTVDAGETLLVPPGQPLVGLPTVDRDGDGLPESYRIRLPFEASRIDLVPSYYPEWDISLNISQSEISADDVFGPPPHGPIALTATVRADGAPPPGGSRVVEFEVIYSPDPAAVPLGQPTVAAMTYEKNGIASAWIVAGGLPTEAGPVIIKAEIPDYTGKAVIDILPGVAVPGVTGLCAWNERASSIGLTERDVCETIELTVLLAGADQFGNPIYAEGITGEAIDILYESAVTIPVPVEWTVTTDDNGLAPIFIDASELLPLEEADVTASWDSEIVEFMLKKVEVPHLACFLGEPAFRVNTLQIDKERVRCVDESCSNCLAARACNSLGGLAASITNPELQGALDDGEANITFVYKGLTADNWTGPTTTIVVAAINGLCGVPYAPTDCDGGETEFFVEPSYYNTTISSPTFKDLNLVYPNTLVAGYTEVNVGTLSLPFPTDLGPVELTLCNLVVSGTVKDDLSGITGGLLTGAITEESLKDLIEKGMGMPWELAVAVLGDFDTQCNGDNAYSVLLHSTAERVTLYKVPEWY